MAVGPALATAFVRIRPDTAGFGRDLDNQIKREADGQRTGEKIGKDLGNGISKGMSPLITAAVGLGPALVPALAASTAAAGGLGVALASGGAALGVFGAVAKESFKTIQDNIKAAKNGAQDISGPVGRATANYVALTAAWDKFVEHNQPQVFRAFGAGFGILTSAIPKLQPLFNVASEAVLRLEGQLGHFVDSGGLGRLVGFLTSNARPALEAFRQTFTNLFTGIGALSPLFARFAGGVETGLVQLSAKFAAWAQNGGPSGGFQRFINYVVGVAPELISTFHELASAVVNIGQGLAPLGPASLSFVGAMARLLAVLPPGAITGIAAGFVAVQGALKISAAASALLSSSLVENLANIRAVGAASKLLNFASSGVGIGLVSLALTGLIGVFVKHQQAVAESRARTEDFRTTLDKTTAAITLDTRAMAAHNLQASGALDAALKLGLGLSTITDAAVGNQGAIQNVNLAVANVRREYDQFVGSGQAVDKNLADQNTAATVLGKALGTTSAEVSNAQAKQRQLQAATQPTTVAIVDQRQQAARASLALEKLATDLLRVAGVNLSAAQTELQFRDSLHSLTQSVQDNGRSLSENTVKGRANRAAVLDSISAALQHADAVAKQATETGHASTAQARAQAAFQNSIPAIRDQAAKLGLNKRAVDQLIASIGGLKPKTVAVTATVSVVDKLNDSRVSVDLGGGRKAVRQTGLATGGTVPGFSMSDTSDNVPIMATAGEYMIKRPTARKLERQAPGFLDALNAGQVDVGGDSANMRVGFGQRLKFAAGGRISRSVGTRAYTLWRRFMAGGPAVFEDFTSRGAGGPASDALADAYYRRHRDFAARLVAPWLLGVAHAGDAQYHDRGNGSRLARDYLRGRLLGFAAGGSIPAVQEHIRATDPLPYIWGAAGPFGYDCSGLVGAVYGALTGKGGFNGERYFTTDSIGAAQGFRPGLGTFSVGVTPGRGHMAGQLGSLKFEARSTASGIHVGPSAQSVTSFARHFFLPQFGGTFGFDALTARQKAGIFRLIAPDVSSDLASRISKLDTGGYLQPGLNVAWNDTGGRERVLDRRETEAYERGGPMEVTGTLKLNGDGTATISGQLARFAARGSR